MNEMDKVTMPAETLASSRQLNMNEMQDEEVMAMESILPDSLASRRQFNMNEMQDEEVMAMESILPDSLASSRQLNMNEMQDEEVMAMESILPDSLASSRQLNMNEMQDEEVMAMESILPDSFAFNRQLNSGKLIISIGLESSMKIKLLAQEAAGGRDHCKGGEVQHLPPLEVHFQLTASYPHSEMPGFRLACSWMSQQQLEAVGAAFKKEWKPGEVVLYSWYELLSSHWRSILDLVDNTLEIEEPSLLADLVEYNRKEEVDTFNQQQQECQICFKTALGVEFSRIEECGHAFCASCVGNYCEAAIRDAKTARGIRCPGYRCDGRIQPDLVRSLVSMELWQLYDQRLLDFALRSMSNTIWCPKIDCQYPAQLMEGSLGLCPSCHHAFCTKCNKLYHGVEKCSTEESLAAMGVVEEETEAATMSAEAKVIVEILETYKKHGREKAQHFMKSMTGNLFNHLSKEEQKKLAKQYSSGDAQLKEKYDDMYGSLFMSYFAAGALNIPSFDINTFLHKMLTDTTGSYKRVLEINLLSSQSRPVKPCPSCIIPIERSAGCNHMYCTHCSTHFCWECLHVYPYCLCHVY